MDGRIFHLRKRMLEKLQYDWTIEELSQIVELSIPHFQKLFKTETGIAPIVYLRELRLEKACELLENTFHQIKQIGFEVGMPNDSHFTRDFKKKYGLTPTEYRKQYWERIQAEKSDGLGMIEFAKKKYFLPRNNCCF